MPYRDLPYTKVSGPKYAVNINFTKISTKITQTLYIPLDNVVPVHPIWSYGTLADLPFNGKYSHIQLM